MKLLTLVLPLLVTVVVSGAELTGAEINKAYFTSYELEKQQRYGEAAKALNPVVAAYPNSYTVNYRKGWLAYCMGSYADAKKFYGIALTQYPSSIEIRKGMILVDVARKSWKEVEMQARTGRKTDYYNVDFCYWQAVSLRLLGQSEQAGKVLEEISLLYPTNVNILVELARLRLAQNKRDQALALLDSVYVLDPYNQEVLELLKQIKK